MKICQHILFIYLFWTIFIQGCPVQWGWFEWGPNEKKKNNTQKKITDKKTLEQLSIAKVLEAQFGLDLKCLFRPKPNLFKSCLLLRARGRVFQILAPLNLKEHWYLVVRARGRRNKSLWRVLYEWKSCVSLNSLTKYARARPWRFLNTSMHFR